MRNLASWFTGIKKTPMFETIHPMTYFFVIQNIVWGLFVITSLLISGEMLFPGDAIYWPEPFGYVWALVVVVGAVIQFFSLFRDCYSHDKNFIWRAAQVNMTVWAFSPILWIAIGAYSMLIVSVFGILGYAYIGLAKKLHRPGRRV